MKVRLFRWVFLLLIGFGIGALIIHFQKQAELEKGVVELSPDDQASATILKSPVSKPSRGSVDVGGSFELVDHNGKTVTQDDFKDTYKLIFFGFTFCPAVCPTELQKVAVILDELGEETAAKITPILVSVDPERDTPEVMKDYVAQYHPRLIGLTGSQEQIDSAKDAFKVYAAKVENDLMEGYMMDHSAFLYLTDKDNKMIKLYPSKDSAQDIAEDIKALDIE